MKTINDFIGSNYIRFFYYCIIWKILFIGGFLLGLGSIIWKLINKEFPLTDLYTDICLILAGLFYIPTLKYRKLPNWVLYAIFLFPTVTSICKRIFDITW